jgi:hypothetical protein
LKFGWRFGWEIDWLSVRFFCPLRQVSAFSSSEETYGIYDYKKYLEKNAMASSDEWPESNL